MRSKLMALVAAAVVAVPAMAQTADTTAKPEKKICRRAEPATGSIMPARPVCHTKSEWASIDAANADAIDRMQANKNGRYGTDQGGGVIVR